MIMDKDVVPASLRVPAEKEVSEGLEMMAALIKENVETWLV